MPFINFKTVNAKNHKDGNVKKKTKIWLIYLLRFQSLAGIWRSKRGFVKKNQGNKIKDSGKAPYNII